MRRLKLLVFGIMTLIHLSQSLACQLECFELSGPFFGLLRTHRISCDLAEVDGKLMRMIEKEDDFISGYSRILGQYSSKKLKSFQFQKIEIDRLPQTPFLMSFSINELEQNTKTLRLVGHIQGSSLLVYDFGQGNKWQQIHFK